MREKGCPICDSYSKTENVYGIEGLIWEGEFDFEAEKIRLVVVPSRKWSVSRDLGGKHLILTTWSHHVGPERQKLRSELNKIATRVAHELLGENYRLTNNSGNLTSTLEHYHVHLVFPGKQRIVREVANVEKVIKETVNKFNLEQEVADFLDKELLQQK